MASNDVVIAGYAETEIRFRGGKSAYELAGMAFEALLDSTGLDKSAIDGLAVSNALSQATNPFHPIFVNDALGITPTWLIASATGGCSPLAGVARAASAIRDGQCNVAVVMSADAPTLVKRPPYGGYRTEFDYPEAVPGPPATFGLLMRRYMHQFGLDERALGKIAITQRQHAIENPNALAKFRRPLTMDEYLQSRMIAEPLRLLDCVMSCDGANAVLVTTEAIARSHGLQKFVRPTAYAEITNYRATSNLPDITDNGFKNVAPRIWRQSGMAPGSITHLQPYDDFTIAVMLQLEAFGFCDEGAGSSYVLDTDLSYRGTIPLNTGGGQISCGQPGLASGGVQLVEAVRQMFGEAQGRQVANPQRALVTGIGGVLYARNWTSSAAMILEA